MAWGEAHTSPEADVANLRVEMDACRAEISRRRIDACATITPGTLATVRHKITAARSALTYGRIGKVSPEQTYNHVELLLAATAAHLVPEGTDGEG